MAKAVAFAGGTRVVIQTRKATVQNTYWGSRLVDNRRFGAELEALPLRGVWLSQFPGYQRWSQEQGQELLDS